MTVITFPLLLDRDVGAVAAVTASIRGHSNPVPVLLGASSSPRCRHRHDPSPCRACARHPDPRPCDLALYPELIAREREVNSITMA